MPSTSRVWQVVAKMFQIFFMRTARIEGLDRLRAPNTVSSRHRALLMDEIQKRDFVPRLESTMWSLY